jgi:hypothetical protein
MTHFPTPPTPNTAGGTQIKTYKHMYETQEREMNGVWVTSTVVTVVPVTSSHKSIAATHVTYAYVHDIVPGKPWHRITIMP